MGRGGGIACRLMPMPCVAILCNLHFDFKKVPCCMSELRNSSYHVCSYSPVSFIGAKMW